MTDRWMSGDEVRQVGRDLGLSEIEIAAELHVPVWQLNDPGFSACLCEGGGWETHWQARRSEGPSGLAALLSGMALFIVGLAGAAGVYALVRVLW